MVGASEDTSCLMSSRTVSPSLMCGVTVSCRPTSLRSMVWNGLVGWFVPPVVCVLVYWPVRNGTSWPTLITASWLSSVTTEGVDSTLLRASILSARTSAPISSSSLSVPGSLMVPVT